MSLLTKSNESKWKETQIGEEIELVYGKSLPQRNRVPGEYPVFGSNGKVGTHDHYLVEAPGIIIGRKGSVGEIVLSKENFWAIDTTYYVKVKGDNDLLFWYYFLQTIGLRHMNTHSAVPGLNRDRVYFIDCKIPPILEQRRIASILSALDDKIELNNEMNKNLEETAMALFKHWFVDFEFPNKDGKPYASSGGKMIDSELGLIPEGWGVDLLGNHIKIIKGKKPKITSETQENSFLPYILIESMNGKIKTYAHPEKIINCSKEDTIMVMDGASSGRVSIGFDGVLGSTLAKIIPSTKKLRKYYLFSFLKFKESAIQLNLTGSAIPHADKDYIKGLTVSLPPEKIIDTFDGFINIMINQRIINRMENVSLAETRASLLPKLMSGEIRV